MKEQSKITFQSLQEGDIFDRDIKRIMAIINGVEKQFCERKVTKDFKNALHNAYKMRVLQVDHDQIIDQTVSQQNSSMVQRRQGKSFVMPSTYATVVNAALNTYSGDLNLSSNKHNLAPSPKLSINRKGTGV